MHTIGLQEGRTSADEQLAALSVEGRKERKKAASEPWRNIFASSKIIVKIRPRDMNNPAPMVAFGHANFFDTFGWAAFPDRDYERPLADLYGHGTIRLAAHQIEKSILQGRSMATYINLYRQDDVPLSCYVYVQSLSQVPRNANKPVADPGDEVASAGDVTKYAVVTIRSASVVGNAKRSGVGLLGLDGVSLEVRVDALDNLNARTHY
jgi:hypothetical protein